MKKLIFSVLFLAPLTARAHLLDIRPVRAALRLDGDRLRVSLAANAIDWRFLAGGLPEGAWTEPDRAKAARYLADHFKVAADAAPLLPQVLSVRLAQPLFVGSLRVEARFQVVYDLPPGAANLSVEARFFEEDWKEIEGRGKAAPKGYLRVFETVLRWRPGPGGAAVLPLSSPRWERPVSFVRRSVLRRWMESVWAGAAAGAAGGVGVLWLAAVLLFPPTAVSRRSLGWGIAVLLMAAGVLRGVSGDGTMLFWAALIIAAAGSVDFHPDVFWFAALLSGATGFVWEVGKGAGAYPLESGFLSFSRFLSFCGALALVAVSWGARKALGFFYRHHFRTLTPDEISAQSLFHRRVAARLLGILGLYGVLSPLWQSPR
jgi:hypothetical protein